MQYSTVLERLAGRWVNLITASLKFEVYFRRCRLETCAQSSSCSSHSRKRRRGTSIQMTPHIIISQHILADPSMTSLELKGHDSLLNSDPESGLGRLLSPVRPLKVRQGRLVFYVDKEFPRLTTRTPTGKGKGKMGGQPPASPARTPSSESALSPRKPKAIRQAFEKPHFAPARWCEMHDVIKEMRSQFLALVVTIGCDTIKWKEMDPRVRDACHGIRLESPTFLLTYYYLPTLPIARRHLFFSLIRAEYAIHGAHFARSLVPNQERCDGCSCGPGQALRSAWQYAQPRGSAHYRGAGHRGRHQRSWLLSS